MCYTNNIRDKLSKLKRKDLIMSYYGIRNLKTIQDNEGNWNFTCELYDSCIWSYDNKRVWEKFEGLKKSFKTKEELEHYLFTNTLDGNFHGTGGKYGCLAWGNCKVTLSDEDSTKLQELEKIKRETKYSEEACKKYSEFRYSAYFKAWKEYLKNKEQNKANKRIYLVTVDFNGYKGVYIKSHGTSTTSFTYYEADAKLFNNTLEEMKKCLVKQTIVGIKIIHLLN